MLGKLVEHPLNSDFWRHDPPARGTCWVCGEDTSWIYLDQAFQHPDCDAYPTEDGGDVVIIGGVI